MKNLFSLVVFAGSLLAQGSVSPSYFATTGLRYNYYDNVATETTNFGVRVAGTQTGTVTIPNGFWSITSIDATPRSQSSSAGLRESASYFLSRQGNITFYAHAGVGAQTVSNTTGNTTSTSLLGNLDGGMGVIWNICKTFNPNAKINCMVVGDYSILAVSTQAVKPVIGIFFGTSF